MLSLELCECLTALITLYEGASQSTLAGLCWTCSSPNSLTDIEDLTQHSPNAYWALRMEK